MQVTFTINELWDEINEIATRKFEEQREQAGTQSGLPTRLELQLDQPSDNFLLRFRFALPNKTDNSHSEE